MLEVAKPFRAVSQQLTSAMVQAYSLGYKPTTEEALEIVKALFTEDVDSLRELCDNLTHCDPDYPHTILGQGTNRKEYRD